MVDFELDHVISECGTFIGGLLQWVINSKLGHSVFQCDIVCRVVSVSKIVILVFFPTGIGEHKTLLRECEGVVDLDWQLWTSRMVNEFGFISVSVITYLLMIFFADLALGWLLALPAHLECCSQQVILK